MCSRSPVRIQSKFANHYISALVRMCFLLVYVLSSDGRYVLKDAIAFDCYNKWAHIRLDMCENSEVIVVLSSDIFRPPSRTCTEALLRPQTTKFYSKGCSKVLYIQTERHDIALYAEFSVFHCSTWSEKTEHSFVLIISLKMRPEAESDIPQSHYFPSLFSPPFRIVFHYNSIFSSL
jgi:hypothetical protein